jgi:hypothetical protein
MHPFGRKYTKKSRKFQTLEQQNKNYLEVMKKIPIPVTYLEIDNQTVIIGMNDNWSDASRHQRLNATLPKVKRAVTLSNDARYLR